MTQHQQHSTQQGGSGNSTNDPDRASEAGKKGGQHSHDEKTGSKGGQHSHNKGDSEAEGRGTEESQGEEE